MNEGDVPAWMGAPAWRSATTPRLRRGPRAARRGYLRGAVVLVLVEVERRRRRRRLGGVGISTSSFRRGSLGGGGGGVGVGPGGFDDFGVCGGGGARGEGPVVETSGAQREHLLFELAHLDERRRVEHEVAARPAHPHAHLAVLLVGVNLGGRRGGLERAVVRRRRGRGRRLSLDGGGLVVASVGGETRADGRGVVARV